MTFRGGLLAAWSGGSPTLNVGSRSPLAQRNLGPLAILIDERARLFDRKATRETGITLQKMIDCLGVSGRHFPFSIFTNQILLDHQFAIAVEGLGDMSEHRRINDREISRDAHRADLYSLKLIKILGSLQTLDQLFARDARAR